MMGKSTVETSTQDVTPCLDCRLDAQAGQVRELSTRGTVSGTLVEENNFAYLLYAFYGMMVLVMYHHAAWLVPLALLIPRLLQQQHYIHHMRAPHRLPFVTRLAYYADTPIGLGWAETGSVHDSHHKYSCDPVKDMQYSIMTGSYMGVEAFLRAFIQPELDFYNYVIKRHMELDKTMAYVRLVLFVAMSYFWGSRFFYLIWFPCRFQRAQFYFFAFHFQHRDGEKWIPEGKNVHFPPLMRWFIILVNGEENALAAEYHIVHHDKPGQPLEQHALPTSKCPQMHPVECIHRHTTTIPRDLYMFNEQLRVENAKDTAIATSYFSLKFG